MTKYVENIMSNIPLTISNLINEVTILGGNVIVPIEEYDVVLSTNRTDVDLICGLERDDEEYVVLEMSTTDAIDVLVDFIRTSSSGLSEDSITSVLHRVIPQHRVIY